MTSKTYTEKMVERCSQMIVEALQNISIEDINMYQLGYEKGKADERAKVLELITQRLQKPCDIEFCDECEECCEVSALMWLDERLKEETTNEG